MDWISQLEFSDVVAGVSLIVAILSLYFAQRARRKDTIKELENRIIASVEKVDERVRELDKTVAHLSGRVQGQQDMRLGG